MEIAIRKPRPEEAQAFAGLHVQCWRESLAGILPEALLASFSTAKRLPLWQAVLQHPQRFVMGAYADGLPCGFVISGATDERLIPDQDGHLWALYILAAQHRRGLGRRLVSLAARDWQEKGGHSMTVGVLAENHAARRFYESLGARLVKKGNYVWDGHALPDCIYLWDDLAKIAKV